MKNPNDPTLGTAVGETSINGTFGPVGATMGGGGHPTAVPLPPAAYSALGVMAAFALLTAFQRWLSSADRKRT